MRAFFFGAVVERADVPPYHFMQTTERENTMPNYKKKLNQSIAFLSDLIDRTEALTQEMKDYLRKQEDELLDDLEEEEKRQCIFPLTKP